MAATVGLAVLRYRDANGLTQAALARKCSISRSRYNQVESCRQTGMHVVTLMRLADGCEKTPNDMLGFVLDRRLMPGVWDAVR